MAAVPEKVRYIALTNYIAKGIPDEKYFQILEKPLPALGNNQLLIKLEYISVDPYQRNRMTGKQTVVPPFEIGKPLEGSAVGRVIASTAAKFQAGDMVGFMGEWAEFVVRDADRVRRLFDGVDPEAALSVVGLVGLSAYFGMLQVGQLRSDDVVVITGAAGGVGSIAGALAKIKGARVIGICGSDEKCAFIKESGEFDEALNYKKSTLDSDLARCCPKGISLFFDCVGGETADIIRKRMADFGRIVQCGAISLYNNGPVVGPRFELDIVQKSLTHKGFRVFDFHAQFDNALNELAAWYKEGKIKKHVTVKSGGFQYVPRAFIDLFHGNARGKLLIRM